MLDKIRYNSRLWPNQTWKPKMLIHCSEMTVNYIVMHWNTLPYAVIYTSTQCSSGNKTRPDNVAERQILQQNTCDYCKTTVTNITEVFWRHCFFLKMGHYEKRWLSKNDCIRLVKKEVKLVQTQAKELFIRNFLLLFFLTKLSLERLTLRVSGVSSE